MPVYWNALFAGACGMVGVLDIAIGHPGWAYAQFAVASINALIVILHA